MSLAAANDQAIATALTLQEQNDYVLAAALYESHKGKLYRLWNFPTLKAYLAERFNGQDVDGQARMCARTYHRLIKDFIVAQEIKIFREHFDKLGRVKRRLLAPILTRDNAEEWVTLALSVSARELEVQILASQDGSANEKVTRTFRLFRQQAEVLQAALDAAGVSLEGDVPDHMKLEAICAEFIAGHGGDVKLAEGEIAYTQEAYGFHLQCPSCRQVVVARRRPDMDVADTLVLVCNRCTSGIVVRAVTLEREDTGHGGDEDLRGESVIRVDGCHTP